VDNGPWKEISRKDRSVLFWRSKSPFHGVVWIQYPQKCNGSPNDRSNGYTTDVTQRGALASFPVGWISHPQTAAPTSHSYHFLHAKYREPSITFATLGIDRLRSSVQWPTSVS
jgi:hypothetical protein